MENIYRSGPFTDEGFVNNCTLVVHLYDRQSNPLAKRSNYGKAINY